MSLVGGHVTGIEHSTVCVCQEVRLASANRDFLNIITSWVLDASVDLLLMSPINSSQAWQCGKYELYYIIVD